MLNRARLIKQCMELGIDMPDGTPTYRLHLLLREYKKSKAPRIRRCALVRCTKPLSKYNPNRYCFAHIMAGFKQEQSDEQNNKYKAKERREHASQSSNQRAVEGNKRRTTNGKSKPKGKSVADKRRSKSKV